MREIRALTGVRGLAACYVMFYHFADRKVAIGRGPLEAFINHGYIAVDLFFALSGFVMALTYRGLFAEGAFWPAQRAFLARRVARVYPLYAVLTLAMAVLVVLGRSDIVPRAALGTYLGANLLMIQSWVGLVSLDFPAWSISTEWGAYMVFPFLLLLAYRSSRTTAIATGVAAFGLLALVALLPGWSLHHPGRDGTLNVFEGVAGPMGRCLTEFTFGLLSFRFAESAPGRRLAASGPGGIVLALLVGGGLCLPDADLALAALFPLLVVAVSADRGPVARALGSRPLHALGVWSYAIYLIHPHVAQLVAPVRRALYRAGVGHVLLLTDVVGMLLAIALAAAAYRLIEQPGRRVLQHLLGRGARARPVVRTVPGPAG